MAVRIIVTQIPPYDGEYEFDDRTFSTRELRWIKQIAGYLPMKLNEGLEGGDADLYIALTVIAMKRAGKITREQVLDVADRLADVPLEDSRIRFVGDDEGADAVPPDGSPSTNGQHGSSPRNSSDWKPSSGTPSETGLESQGSTPLPTGTTR